MEHSLPARHPRADEFLKFYFALTLLDALLAVVRLFFFPQPTSFTPTAPGLMDIIFGIISFAVFVLSIVAWVRFAKRNYPKFLLITPILRIFTPVLLTIAGVVLSIAFFFNAATELNVNAEPTPEQIESLAPQMKWLTALPLIQTAVILGVGIWSLARVFKLPEQTETHANHGKSQPR